MMSIQATPEGHTPPAELLIDDSVLEDAARYRWLRQQHWSQNTLAVVRCPKTAVRLGHECPSYEALDAAIDAARSV